MSNVERIFEALKVKHGELMTADETSSALKLGSRGALNMARARKRVALAPVRIAGRRGYLYRTSEVAQQIAVWLDEGRI